MKPAGDYLMWPRAGVSGSVKRLQVRHAWHLIDIHTATFI